MKFELLKHIAYKKTRVNIEINISLIVLEKYCFIAGQYGGIKFLSSDGEFILSFFLTVLTEMVTGTGIGE
jgi:hypothetical protein